MKNNFNLTEFLKKNRLLNENIGGYTDLKPINVNEEIETGMEEDGNGMGKNSWIADIDRMPSVDGWKATWEYPGIISWSHPEITDARVVATPEFDGPGTPVEFQSEAGSTQMFKILDQDDFKTFKDYANAIRPYLKIVADANEVGLFTEELGTAMEEGDSDFNQTADDLMADLINQEDVAMFKAAIQGIVYDLYEGGFDIEDIQAYLIKLLKTY